jgi:hypothetical protein
MKEFLLLPRAPETQSIIKLTPEEETAMFHRWEDWLGSIAAQGRFISRGRLMFEGNVLKKGGVISDGPFVEIKEMLLGFILVKAENLDDATTLAHGCPAIDLGGSVEVRPLFG